MKKIIKKLTAIVLSCLIAFSVLPVAFAANGTDKPTMPSGKGDTYNHLPQVYVLGFGSTNIYYENDPEKKPLLAPIDTDRLLGNLKNIDNYLISAIKNKQPDLLRSCLYSFFDESFGMLKIMPDGISSVPGVAAEPTVLAYEGYGKYTFYYDSRLNPLDIVASLDEYISQVLEDSGAEKVELVGTSYGSNVVATYLHEYQSKLDRVDSVLLCVPSTLGIDFFGELLSGEINVDPDAFEDFIADLLENAVIGDYLKILNKMGILDLLVDAMVVPVFREAVFDAFLDIARNILATIPALWATVSDKYFYSSLENMFGENYRDPSHEYAATIEKVIDYHETIKVNAEDIILEAKAENEHLKPAVICKYGSPAIPLSKEGDLMSDGLATLEVSSFGATCVRFGKQLPADYTQAQYPEYNFISVNRNIDASTSILPFSTWIIKGLVHKQKNEDYWKLIDEIIYRDLDVFTDPEIPQFLQVSDEDVERLIPLAEEEFEGETTVFCDILNILKNIILGIVDYIWNLFGKVFK